jgi:hypothetical protein
VKRKAAWPSAIAATVALILIAAGALSASNQGNNLASNLGLSCSTDLLRTATNEFDYSDPKSGHASALEAFGTLLKNGMISDVVEAHPDAFKLTDDGEPENGTVVSFDERGRAIYRVWVSGSPVISAMVSQTDERWFLEGVTRCDLIN